MPCHFKFIQEAIFQISFQKVESNAYIITKDKTVVVVFRRCLAHDSKKLKKMMLSVKTFGHLYHKATAKI